VPYSVGKHVFPHVTDIKMLKELLIDCPGNNVSSDVSIP
jgi:hypothetical protein